MTLQSPLRNIIVATTAVVAAGFVTGASAFFIPAPNPSVTEFFNHYTRHYVLISDGAEMAAIDAGSAGPGWIRTGYSFEARKAELYPANVCRFYAPPPTNSHFFTANSSECEELRTSNSGWIYEKTDFSIDVPQNGACAAGLQPIYRVYNNRWMASDSNHRFVHDAGTRDAMIASGWVDEGIAFCAKFAHRAERKAFLVETEQIRPTAECEDESVNIGSCVALNQIPRLTNRITSWLPPSYVTLDPLFSQRYPQVTGFDGNVYTAQPVADTQAVASHSFAQTSGSSIFGVHVSYRDRTAGDLASINPLYQFRTTAPAAGAPDERLLPWLYPVENEIHVAFDINVKTVRRLNAGSHAYGHPTLQFLDTTSGQTLYVTLGTFGTGVSGTPGDYIALDTATGRVIVGTAFRADPLFGHRVAGNFMHCDTEGTCGAGKTHFEFRISRADFAKVLSLARPLNPRLSDVPANYLLANFHFNSEIYREAELGLTLSSYQLSVFGY